MSTETDHKLPVSTRWSEFVDEDDDTEKVNEVSRKEASVVVRPINPVPAQLEKQEVVTDSDLKGDWRIQGRKRDVVKKEAVQRPLILFASLPFDKRLLYRGVVRGQTDLLSTVQRKGFERFHGYDPVSQHLVWRRKPTDVSIGVEKASPQYVAKVMADFGEEVKAVLSRKQ